MKSSDFQFKGFPQCPQSAFQGRKLGAVARVKDAPGFGFFYPHTGGKLNLADSGRFPRLENFDFQGDLCAWRNGVIARLNGGRGGDFFAVVNKAGQDFFEAINGLLQALFDAIALGDCVGNVWKGYDETAVLIVWGQNDRVGKSVQHCIAFLGRLERPLVNFELSENRVQGADFKFPFRNNGFVVAVIQSQVATLAALFFNPYRCFCFLSECLDFFNQFVSLHGYIIEQKCSKVNRKSNIFVFIFRG